ncbi:MAG: hypothetical protein RLZZ488_14 [Pseudomonadota bacterium]|jgi:hypothetical protein
MMTLFLIIPLLTVAGCQSSFGKKVPAELSDSEAAAMARLDAEAEKQAVLRPSAPQESSEEVLLPKYLIRAPDVRKKSADDSFEASSAQCYDFQFFGQRKDLLNRDPATICKGDPDKQIFLRSRQGRVAIVNISADAIVDPVAGITFLSQRKLLCFDHNFPPNARGGWGETGDVVINCCSDVSFQRFESGNPSSAIAGRVEGPPPNCGQD